MKNRYAGTCCFCRERCEPGQGRTWKWRRRWVVAHSGCNSERAEARRWDAGIAAAGGVIEIEIGDKSFIQNANGRCEDAPCCGCCTI